MNHDAQDRSERFHTALTPPQQNISAYFVASSPHWFDCSKSRAGSCGRSRQSSYWKLQSALCFLSASLDTHTHVPMNQATDASTPIRCQPFILMLHVVLQGEIPRRDARPHILH